MIGSTARSSMTSRSQYRKMSAGNPQYSEMELISTVLVGSAGVASVTFTDGGAWSGYRHLQLRMVTRSNRAAVLGYGRIRFNGDSAANYAQHNLYGNGTSVASDSATALAQTFAGLTVGATATSSVYSPIIVDILDAFSTTKNKVTRSLSGTPEAPANAQLRLVSGLWLSTTAITSISLFDDANTWVAGSRFSLYGVK